MTIEITTSRGIAPQILRHRSFSFQEFSQRYAKADASVTYSARRQDQKIGKTRSMTGSHHARLVYRRARRSLGAGLSTLSGSSR